MNYEEAKKKLEELEWMKAWANATVIEPLN